VHAVARKARSTHHACPALRTAAHWRPGAGNISHAAAPCAECEPVLLPPDMRTLTAYSCTRDVRARAAGQRLRAMQRSCCALLLAPLNCELLPAACGRGPATVCWLLSCARPHGTCARCCLRALPDPGALPLLLPLARVLRCYLLRARRRASSSGAGPPLLLPSAECVRRHLPSALPPSMFASCSPPPLLLPVPPHARPRPTQTCCWPIPRTHYYRRPAAAAALVLSPARRHLPCSPLPAMCTATIIVLRLAHLRCCCVRARSHPT
jgi:hypothetical protein